MMSAPMTSCAVERRPAGGPGSPARGRCPASGSACRRSKAPRYPATCRRKPSCSRLLEEMPRQLRNIVAPARARAAGGAAPRSGGRTDPRGTGPAGSAGAGRDGWRRRCAHWPGSACGRRPVVYSPSCSTRSRRVCASGGMSPISSRNSVPPVGLLEAAALALERAGEGALLMAEQLAFDQVARDRRHVDGDERPVAPLAVVVQRPRHQLLAGAGFAGDHAPSGRCA